MGPLHRSHPVEESLRNAQEPEPVVAVVDRGDMALRMGSQAYAEAGCCGVDNCQDDHTDHLQAVERMEQPASRLEQHQQGLHSALRKRKQPVHRIARSAALPRFVRRSRWRCGQHQQLQVLRGIVPLKEVDMSRRRSDAHLRPPEFHGCEHLTCR